ncbi:hypothetical protein Holit_01525 [Hollandina sp. SP2]
MILAGVGTGCFTYEDIQGWQVFDPPVKPRNKAQKVYDRLFKIYKSLYRNLKEDFADLSRMSRVYYTMYQIGVI